MISNISRHLRPKLIRNTIFHERVTKTRSYGLTVARHFSSIFRPRNKNRHLSSSTSPLLRLREKSPRNKSSWEMITRLCRKEAIRTERPNPFNNLGSGDDTSAESSRRKPEKGEKTEKLWTKAHGLGGPPLYPLVGPK
ncbi:hypothetical protein Trydic_g3975 [Trypoxylus dichotomus]